MNIVIQKVEKCELLVENNIISKINAGLLILVGVHKFDDEKIVDYMAKKIAQMRLFKDDENKINKSVLDIQGDILVVSNFTLMAEISSGTRPSFSNGADYEKAENLYLLLAEKFKQNGIKNVQTGKFRHHMHLNTLLDGPFTIVLNKENKYEKN